MTDVSQGVFLCPYGSVYRSIVGPVVMNGHPYSLVKSQLLGIVMAALSKYFCRKI